jgi:hypothetical protein
MTSYTTDESKRGNERSRDSAKSRGFFMRMGYERRLGDLMFVIAVLVMFDLADVGRFGNGHV